MDSARRSILAIAVLATAMIVFLSCAPVISRHEKGAVTVRIGSGSGSRAVTDVVASFSSVTVTVSGDGMGTVSETVTGYSLGSPISLEVPAGDDRLVTVAAVPAASAPTLATEFGGNATVDVDKGKTASANVALALTGTKIVLPNPNGSTWQLNAADSINGSIESGIAVVGIAESLSDFKFDEYGRLLVSSSDGTYSLIQRYGPLSATPTLVVSDPSNQPAGIAPDSVHGRIYFSVSWDGMLLNFVDLSDTATINNATFSSTYNYTIERPIAVDADGNVYIVTYENGPPYNNVILKLAVGAASAGEASSSVLGVGIFTDFGLEFDYSGTTTTLSVKDMIVVDGVLYVLGAQVYGYNGMYETDGYSRGKIIAIDTTTMTKLWEAGWSGDGNKFPTSQSSQLYGPVRFVGIAPRKLYVADEGYYFDHGLDPNPFVDVDRVVEVDLDSQAISGTGLSGASDFFSDFSAYQLY